MRFIYCCAVLCALSCQASESSSKTDETFLKVGWEVVENVPVTLAEFTFTNAGTSDLGDDWELFFNQSYRTVSAADSTAPLDIERIDGDFYRVFPKAGFSLAPGEKASLRYTNSYAMIKASDGPVGAYWMRDGEATPAEVQIGTFDRPEQQRRSASDGLAVPTAASFFAENERLPMLTSEQVRTVVPQPVEQEFMGSEILLNDGLPIQYDPRLENEAKFLEAALAEVGIRAKLNGSQEEDGLGIVLGIYGPNDLPGGAEAYQIIAREAVNTAIMGNTPQGVFHGIQSFLQLLPVDAWERPRAPLPFPAVTIRDTPGLPYRGIHLDIARNFQNKETIERLLDAMAFYKLNKLHLHFNNDEGWRLEIPDLTELTDIGSRRGAAYEDGSMLHPSYGSGPFADPARSHGNGYLTRAEFIDLLRYAKARHVEVIPEVVLPGHQAAAMVSMRERYRRTGDDTYLVFDPDDASEYTSVQGYSFNTMDICGEGTYRFVEKVVDEIQRMYAEAEHPLEWFHVGGDEVPPGPWTASPVCTELIANNPELTSTKDLIYYHRERLYEILKARNLRMAGWEEIGFLHTENGNQPNPDFTYANPVLYNWVNLWGDEDMANRLARTGYDVIMCNVTNTYFDLADNKADDEPGLYWGGYVSTKKVWENQPFQILQSSTTDNQGNPVDVDVAYADREPLRTADRGRIIGLQGQIWSEVIRGRDELEHRTFPKLIALAERAWNPEPEWATVTDHINRERAREEAWGYFANVLGQRELPRLLYWNGGYAFRRPDRGEDGTGAVNWSFPGWVEENNE